MTACSAMPVPMSFVAMMAMTQYLAAVVLIVSKAVMAAIR
jgi:hypothetical protein